MFAVLSKTSRTACTRSTTQQPPQHKKTVVTLHPPGIDAPGAKHDCAFAADGDEHYRNALKVKKGLVDLSQIDFEALKEKFKKTSRKHTEVEKLKGLLEARLKRMLELNHSRVDFLDKFQKLIDEYNAGSKNLEEFFRELVEFAQDLSEEEQRAISEGLSEEELALFDLLTKPEPQLTKQEEIDVKKIARQLIGKIRQEKLVLDWRKRQQTRAGVMITIEKILDLLPPVYTRLI